MFVSFGRVAAACLMLFSTFSNGIGASNGVVSIRLLDSSTGFSIPPEQLQLQPNLAFANGRLELRPVEGETHVVVRHPDYHPFSATIVPSVHSLTFWLEPLRLPAEVDPETVRSWHRSDATILLGFVSDEESGEPLADVAVECRARTRTDDRGFFRLAVPLSEQGATFRVHKPGYISQEFHNIELWPNGDWNYLIRLRLGQGHERLDEATDRRLPIPQTIVQPNALTGESFDAIASPQPNTNYTIRVPRTIRVLLTNTTPTIDYVSMELYCRRSLPREWIASWNGFAGGSNSLKAGAVAVRTYAIGFVNVPGGTNYDICATTSCQVYGNTTSSSTDNAVNQTAGFVMVNSSGAISRGLTEYSSENNSITLACGDGFTAPTGGCIYDPVCSGERRFGHGRGMCQWGSVKWATGLKFPTNSFSNTTATNGFSRRDWIWILQHYYPNLQLVQGAALVAGDEIKVIGTNSLIVRQCGDGGIANGVGCPQVGTKAAGATGTIIDGPQQILADGFGFTWWKIQWSDGLTGWSPENWLDRVIPIPSAPASVAASAASASSANVSWTDTSSTEEGFRIEQAPSSSGPWTVVVTTAGDATSGVASNLDANATYFFRVRAFNLGGQSAPSNVASITTPDAAPALNPIADRTIDENTTLMFTVSASAPERIQTISHFEQFPPNTSGGTVMFRQPTLSGSTSPFLEPSPSLASVTDALPAGNPSARALFVSWSFTNAANPWLRLTTFDAANLPNPVIDVSRRLRFDIYSDRDLLLGLGVRETTNSPGTPVGANGGTVGGIEWAGVTNKVATQPVPNRRVVAGAWRTIEFNFAEEPILNFAGGNGLLSTSSGLAVLEHLAIAPAGGTGLHRIYLDNFVVTQPRRLTYTLEAGVPPGASINPTNGVFTWAPDETQGPGSFPITVRISDDSLPPQTDVQSFTITVRETNQAPVLPVVSNRTIHARTTLVLTNAASDADVPANTLTYDFVGPVTPGASIASTSGTVLFTPGDALANTTNIFAVRVSDNGAPSRSATNSFSVVVLPRPFARAVTSGADVAISWSAISGQRYQVQYNNDLSEENWIDLGPVQTALGTELIFTDTPGVNQRFYRILLVE